MRPIALGGYACHRCDNPMCVNPSHLYEGDARSNCIDWRQRGKSAKNERARRIARLRATPYGRERVIARRDAARLACWPNVPREAWAPVHNPDAFPPEMAIDNPWRWF